MIKSKEGEIRIKGKVNEIRADLVIIFRCLSDENIIEGEDDVIGLYRLSQMREELDEKIKEKLLEELKSKLEEALK